MKETPISIINVYSLSEYKDRKTLWKDLVNIRVLDNNSIKCMVDNSIL